MYKDMFSYTDKNEKKKKQTNKSVKNEKKRSPTFGNRFLSSFNSLEFIISFSLGKGFK